MATVTIRSSLVEEFYNKNHSKSDGKFSSGTGGSGKEKLPTNDAEARAWQAIHGGPTERSRLDRRGPHPTHAAVNTRGKDGKLYTPGLNPKQPVKRDSAKIAREWAKTYGPKSKFAKDNTKTATSFRKGTPVWKSK